MIDWTPKRAGAVKGVRTIQHYGHPDCPHDEVGRRSRVLDDMVVVTCRCGMEQRFVVSKTRGFPRQRR